jgi:hypothetical protein
MSERAEDARHQQQQREREHVLDVAIPFGSEQVEAAARSINVGNTTPVPRRPTSTRKMLWKSAVFPSSSAAAATASTVGAVLLPRSSNVVAPVMIVGRGKVESVTEVKRPHPPLFDRSRRTSETPNPKRNLLLAL